MRTARRTGDPELDAVVLDRLERASRQPRADRSIAVELVVMVVVVPVTAALRTSPWWLVSLAGTVPAVALLLVRTFRPEDPRVRLARFRSGLLSAPVAL